MKGDKKRPVSMAVRAESDDVIVKIPKQKLGDAHMIDRRFLMIS